MRKLCSHKSLGLGNHIEQFMKCQVQDRLIETLAKSGNVSCPVNTAIEICECCCRKIDQIEIIIQTKMLTLVIRRVLLCDDELSREDRKKLLQHCIKDMVAYVENGHVSVTVASQTIHTIGTILGLNTSSKEVSQHWLFLFSIPPSSSPSHIRIALSSIGYLEAVAVCYGPKTFGIGIFCSSCSCDILLPSNASSESRIFVRGKAVHLFSILDISMMRKFPRSAFSRYQDESCFYTVTSNCSGNESDNDIDTPTISETTVSTIDTNLETLRVRVREFEEDELLYEQNFHCPIFQVRKDLENLVQNVEELVSHAIIKTYMLPCRMSVEGLSPLQIEALLFSQYLSYNSDSLEIEDRRALYLNMIVETFRAIRAQHISQYDATRILFECAALIGLSLLNEVPKTLLIVTGINKNINGDDWRDAFSKHGDIEDTAKISDIVLVRYKHESSVRVALANYRVGRVSIKGCLLTFRAVRGNIQCDLHTINENW